MAIRKVLFAAWILVMFFVTAATYQMFVESFALVVEPWHQRFIASNWKYAFALFFVLLILLWHGLAAAYFGRSYRTFVTLYKSLVIPLGISIALLHLVPFEYDFHLDGRRNILFLLVSWVLIIADPAGNFGNHIASSGWFRFNVLKQGEVRSSLLHKGMDGKMGLVVFHAALLMLFLGGLVTT